MNSRIPAIVLNCEAHGGLGIVRSLGRLGVSVFAVHRDRFAPAKFSRYAARGCRWDFASASVSESLAFMQRTGREIGRPALVFACDDDTAMFVANNAAALSGRFLFQQTPADLISSLASKQGLYQLATLHHIPTPATRFPKSRADVLSSVGDMAFPVLLKGIDGLRLARNTGKKMVICHSLNELLANYETLEDPEGPNLMIQEYIPGGADSVWMFNGYFNSHSDCLVSFTGKKLRQCPIHTGATSLGICLKNQAVEESVRGFMKAVGYRGMLDVGMRYDVRDRKYKVLDVNPRIGATFRLFVDTDGMDVARAYYLDMTGQPVTTSAVLEGRRWIVEDMDASASVHYWLERSLTLRAWIQSLRGVQEAGYVCGDDPAPAALRAMSVVRRLASRFFHKLTCRTMPFRRAFEIVDPAKSAKHI
jgi:predicted ATP-grasp superfamily ATP-dependent carboligase